MEAIVWLAVAIVLLVVEIITLGLTTIWFAGGALVACVAAALQADFLVQMILFLVVSAICFVHRVDQFRRTILYSSQKQTGSFRAPSCFYSFSSAGAKH